MWPAGWTDGTTPRPAGPSSRCRTRMHFFDALAYGDGHSETLRGELVRTKSWKGLVVGSKIPPSNHICRPAAALLDDVFPAD